MTAGFHPIAIVGRGCILPGCGSPDALWRTVAGGLCHVGPPPQDDWRIDPSRVLGEPGSADGVDRAWTDQGGYVGALDRTLELSGLALDPAMVDSLDPVFRWSLHAATQALRGLSRAAGGREGVVLGNLSYPTRAHARLAEQYWLERAGAKPDEAIAPLNRFMSGAPAMLVAQAFGMTGGSLALDAACASGLYAIKVACDRLQDGRADLMLAGAVNAVDQWFLHTGFTALNALSRTGQSRPFHAEADGLVPAEGAGFVALKRVEDALAAGDRILGVIRGIGLSNDGRSGGFLSPAREGQMRAMTAALDAAGLTAEQVQYVECHATGTMVGDATEIASLRGVYGDRPLPLGSLKGNVGHLITASGVAGLLKTIAAMEHGQFPVTPGAQPAARDLVEAGYLVPEAPLDWPAIDGQRTAAISGFGFGGNNAHLVVQQILEKRDSPARVRPRTDVVVVGLGLRTHLDPDAASFTGRLLGGRPVDAKFDGDTIALPARQIAFPPLELARALGQQLVLLEVCRQALADVTLPDRQRTGIFVGMQTDSRICLHGVRARWPELLAQSGLGRDNAAFDAADLVASLDAAAVIGEMPNITANRLSNQLDLLGPSFAVSREELSGDAALDLAITALRRGELDAALVGAVEMAREPVHEGAVNAVLGDTAAGAADAALMLVLKTRQAALAAGDPILAVLDDAKTGSPELSNASGGSPVNRLLGHAHAASGLLHVALGIEMVRSRAEVDAQGAVQPLLRRAEPLAIGIDNRSFLGEHAAWRVTEGDAAPRSARAPIRMTRYAASDRTALIDALKNDRPNGDGPCRLAIVGAADELASLRERALRALSTSSAEAWSMDGIHFRAAPLPGEMAFVFTGAASAYPGMARSLLLDMPGLADRLGDRIEDASALADAIYRANTTDPTPFDQLVGSSFVCQLHAVLSLDVLKLRPQASIGLSSGETNAMFAFGVWRDMDRLLSDVAASGLYTEALAGRFDAVRTHWGLPDDEPVNWTNLRVRARAADVAAAIEGHPRAYLTIVNSPDDCVIGGDERACRAALKALGDPLAISLEHDLAVHCAAVLPFQAAWRHAHDRETFAPRLPVRFYANAFRGVIDPTRANVTAALTEQALRTLDFPQIVDLAWRDGVRIFVEHGPRSSLTAAIGEILGDRPYLAVSFDRMGFDGDLQARRTVAALWCAGVLIDFAALDAAAASPAKPAEAPVLRFALRQEAPVFATPAAKTPAAKTSAGRRLPRPPTLAPVVAGAARPIGHVAPDATPAVAAAIAAQAGIAAPPRRASAVAVTRAPSLGRHERLVTAHHNLVEAHRRHLEAQRAGMDAYLAANQRLLAGLLSRATPAAIEPPGRPEPVPPPLPALSTRRPFAPRPLSAPPTAPRPDIPGAPERPGPKFDRSQLEILAGGRISSVFGPSFAGQDGYAVQVRMPEPPLLLCDQVLGIAGEPHSMGRGTIWTRTDVRADSWYLHHGRMPPGIFIECGQADLLLISWLGIDALNQGERAYRLLGCEMTFHGDLPQSGDRLDYEITIDGHARQGAVRLFFFHYDCRIDGVLRISVRNGQAGFFTPAELEHSGGVIWDPATAPYSPDLASRDLASKASLGATSKRAFSTQEVQRYLDGDLPGCFGEAFAMADTHSRTPSSPADHRNFLGEVTELDFAGGPTRRGYLRVETPVTGDEWFFNGHFKNDPCMPGTLMADACLQAMGFYMAASGVTLPRDGWRFQPVRDAEYKFLCRGQVTPSSRRIVYEIFVDEFRSDETPTLFAHVLCTVDGRKAFLCERLGLQLVPDWPLGSVAGLIDRAPDDRPLAHIGDFPLDHRSLIACALGRPSEGFGEGFAMYDAGKRTPRLPGPPYHFMTRIVALEGAMAQMKAGAKVTALYDVPPDAWYFTDNPGGVMPNCVLLEVALQPCGWLASYTLRQDRGPRNLLFRNLDGDGVQHREIGPADGTITTAVELLSVDVMGDLIIEKFAVRCSVGEEEIFRCETVFGFFPPDAMRNQKGFAATAEDLARLAAPSDVTIDLAERPLALYGSSAARLPEGLLLMIDRISGYWPQGGAQKLGAIRAEKDVRSTDWFFKAHFYQDPVQPGSLGVEAMLQAAQALMLLGGMAEGFRRPRFEPLAIGKQTSWHYRGQVTPERGTVSVEYEVAELSCEAGETTVIGQARLWVDGLQIYQARIGMRIVEGDDNLDGPRRLPWSVDLDGSESWLRDHCPTYTLPVAPFAFELELMASKAAPLFPGRKLTEITRADAKTWIALTTSRAEGSVTIEPIGDGIARAMLAEGGNVAATAELRFAPSFPAANLPPLEPLANVRPIDDTYASAAVFHGPAFHLMKELLRGTNGATVTLDGGAGAVPRGLLHPALIDAALHGIPDNPEEWAGQAQAGRAVYPLWIENMRLFGDLAAAGAVTAELRFRGIEDGRFFRVHIRLFAADRLLAAWDLVEILLPKGRLGVRSGEERRAFLKERRFVPGMALADVDAHRSCLSRAEARQSNWLPGTQEQVYGAKLGEDLVARIVAADHAGQALKLHPSAIRIADDHCANLPLNPWPITIDRGEDIVCVTSGDPEPIDWRILRRYWLAQAGGRHRFIHDLVLAMVNRFVRRLVLADPDDFAAHRGRPVLYLANHQNYVESMLFLTMMGALSDLPAAVIAKAEHRDTFIDHIHQLSREAMGAADPLKLMLFNRSQPEELLRLLETFGHDLAKQPRSLLVHVEGLRARRAGAPVNSLSTVLIDVALANDMPIVPVRFAGGLPVEETAQGFILPFDAGRQDHYVGCAISPGALGAMPFAKRAAFVLSKINALGPMGDADRPIGGDERFTRSIAQSKARGLGELQAALRAALLEFPDRGAESNTWATASDNDMPTLVRQLIGAAKARDSV